MGNEVNVTTSNYNQIKDASRLLLAKSEDFSENNIIQAKSIYERHVVLCQLFELIGVSPETAEEDACRVEHYISDETFSCMKTYFEKMQA